MPSYYRARYYNPTTGRFLSEDPAEFSDGINIYKYVHDNPINLIDPYGLGTVQVGINVGGNIPVFGGAGIAGSGFAGIAYDGSQWAFYWGGGGGLGAGAGISGGITLGGSNANNVNGLSGPFIDLGGSGGAGFGGGADVFGGKDSQGNTVLGGDVMGGFAAGASGALQGTYTWVHPFAGKPKCSH